VSVSRRRRSSGWHRKHWTRWAARSPSTMRRPTPGRTASRSGKCTPKVARHHSLYLLCTVNTLVKYVTCTTTVQRWFLQRHDISVTALCIGLSAVFEKTCATTQKNVKSHVFLKSEKKHKNVKKHSFTGRSVTQPLIHNYRNRNSVPVPVSHQHHTPCSEMRTQETNICSLHVELWLLNAYKSP